MRANKVRKLLKKYNIENVGNEVVDKISAYPESDYIALEQVLKNGHEAETVLPFLQEFKNRNSTSTSPEYKALQKGLTVQDALKIKNNSAFEALTILGNSQVDLAAQFINDYQVKALKSIVEYNKKGIPNRL